MTIWSDPQVVSMTTMPSKSMWLGASIYLYRYDDGMVVSDFFDNVPLLVELILCSFIG